MKQPTMIYRPDAKINLGLRVLRRRPDGYHDIATVMVPVDWRDTLIIEETLSGSTSFTCEGMELDCPPEKNLVLKARRELEKALDRELPHTNIRLRKNIPSGAGLGGGSSDASSALKAFNHLHGLGLSTAELARIAARVGADCPFFVHDRPMLVTGIGDVLEPLDLSHLDGLHIVIAKPESTAVSTALAYSLITPDDTVSPEMLAEALHLPMEQWKDQPVLRNDFEIPVFARCPEIAELKDRFYSLGAGFSAMSGSGAAVFALFSDAKMAEAAFGVIENCEKFISRLDLA